MGAQEGLGDRRQHQARDGHRYVQPQGAGRAIAKAVDHVECGVDFTQRRHELVEQARASVRQGNATGRAVEQAHAEPGLEPADGGTQRRGGRAARPGGLAEAAALGHGEEGRKIAQIRRHCA